LKNKYELNIIPETNKYYPDIYKEDFVYIDRIYGGLNGKSKLVQKDGSIYKGYLKTFIKNYFMENKPHILCVDDDDKIRELLKVFLRKKNFSVSTAEGVDEAKRLLNFFIFDIIFNKFY